MKGRGWLIRALGLFLGLWVLWVTAAYVLNVASAEGFPFSLQVGSRLNADYSAEGGESVGAFRLSIVGEALHDEGLSPEQVGEQSEALKEALNSPVPTATARDFDGEDPFTPTPTFTPVPTETSTPTLTYTPTKTPLPTKTPTTKPTKESTSKPKPPSDTKDPQILDFGTLSPPAGDFPGCTGTIRVYALKVVDQEYSSGIKWIKLKYRDPVSGSYVYSSPFYPSPPPGWELGDTWYGYYDLDIHVEISPACGDAAQASWRSVRFGSAFLLTTCSNEFDVYAVAMDEAGNDGHKQLGVYEVEETCIEEPEPTPEG